MSRPSANLPQPGQRPPQNGQPSGLPQAQRPPNFFAIMQKQVDVMLQIVCATLQSNARNEDKKLMFNKRMAAPIISYLDHIERLEDEVNHARAAIRCEYARFKREQARKLEAETLAKQKSVEALPVEPSEPQAAVDVAPEPDNSEQVPPTATEDPTAASIDIDDIFTELAQPAAHEVPPPEQMDLDINFDDADDVSSLLPGLETYANMTTAPPSMVPPATAGTPPIGEVNLDEKPKGASADENELLAGSSLELDDTIFDDLFNIDGAGGFGGEDGNENNNDNEFLTF